MHYSATQLPSQMRAAPAAYTAGGYSVASHPPQGGMGQLSSPLNMTAGGGGSILGPCNASIQQQHASMTAPRNHSRGPRHSQGTYSAGLQPISQGSQQKPAQNRSVGVPVQVYRPENGPSSHLMQPASPPVTRVAPPDLNHSYQPPPAAPVPVPVATVQPATVIGYEVQPLSDPGVNMNNMNMDVRAELHNITHQLEQRMQDGDFHQGTEPSPSPADNEFMRLLDSLEVRVDLMAQMQHTRNQIQARAREVDDPLSSQYCDPNDYDMDKSYQQQGGLEDLAFEIAEVRRSLAQGRQNHSSSRSVSVDTTRTNHVQAAANANESRLQKENSDLWGQLGEQREVISKLTKEVELLRGQLASLGLSPDGGADDLRAQLQAIVVKARETDEECRRHKARALEAEQKLQVAEMEWKLEREHLISEIQALMRGGSKEGAASRAQSPIGRDRAPSPLRSEAGSVAPARRSDAGLNAATNAAALATTPVLPAATQALPAPPSLAPPGYTAPFSRATCGVNVALSEDGYTATRTRGCRQSVIVGSAPLQRQSLGWYFEVEILETVEGWVGGLGIGVTRSGANEVRRVPDKAWRMPNTFIVGYWGCVFLDGKEKRTKWRADTLPAGSRVGLLVSADGTGDLRVFVGGEAVVTAEGALRDQFQGGGADFFPVVDVFAATLSVKLLSSGSPPQPPWRGDNTVLSEPGSPGGTSSISVSRSAVSDRLLR